MAGAADANSISSALTIMSDPCVTSSIPEDITNHEFDANALRLHDGRVTSRAKACSNGNIQSLMGWWK